MVIVILLWPDGSREVIAAFLTACTVVREEGGGGDDVALRMMVIFMVLLEMLGCGGCHCGEGGWWRWSW